MIDQIFSYFASLDDWLWNSLGVPMMIVIGLFFSIRFRFVQVFKFPATLQTFFKAAKAGNDADKGVHPLEAFFTSIGGCIGIGNVVAICTAIQIGGPGAVFWMWIAALLGMLIKYAEVYLGLKFRVENGQGGYDGGPMYYLQQIWKSPWVPILFSILLSIYSTEIYMFSVITHSIATNWHVPPITVAFLLLLLVLFASSGGIARVGKISSVIVTLFLVLFCGMSLWVFFNHIKEVPQVLLLIVQSAFKGHAPLGGFAGAGIYLAISQGMARGCYTGDIGIGYASIVHAESRQQDPRKEAQSAILGIFLDTFVVCTFSTMLVLITGIWHQNIPASELVQNALARYFPYMEFFMPLFLFLLGYSTLIAFFVVGLKCAKFISPKRGTGFYYCYATTVFVIFSILDQKYALTVMSIVGAMLLIMNIVGIFKMRKEIEIFS